MLKNIIISIAGLEYEQGNPRAIFLIYVGSAKAWG